MAGNRFTDGDGLSAIANCESASRTADLVFVHGLGGGSCSTWMNGTDAAGFWPLWVAPIFQPSVCGRLDISRRLGLD